MREEQGYGTLMTCSLSSPCPVTLAKSLSCGDSFRSLRSKLSEVDFVAVSEAATSSGILSPGRSSIPDTLNLMAFLSCLGEEVQMVRKSLLNSGGSWDSGITLRHVEIGQSCPPIRTKEKISFATRETRRRLPLPALYSSRYLIPALSTCVLTIKVALGAPLSRPASHEGCALGSLLIPLFSDTVTTHHFPPRSQ